MEDGDSVPIRGSNPLLSDPLVKSYYRVSGSTEGYDEDDEDEWNPLKYVDVSIACASRESKCTYGRSAFDPNLSTRWFKKTRRPAGDETEDEESEKHKPKDEARNYALGLGFGVPVISKQRNFVDKRTGQHATQRSYLVTSWPSFRKRFYEKGKTKLEDRTFYENIYREDPCRPFVDVEIEEEGVLDEFGRPTEKYRARSESVLRMAEHFSEAVKRLFAKWNNGITDLYVLDSSSRGKFSQHLVFHLDGDNSRFSSSNALWTLFMFWYTKAVVSVDSALKKARAANPRISEEDRKKIANDVFGPDPFFWKCDGEKAIMGSDYKFIADVSVFGDKSREFRLIGSTKSGQSRFMSFREKYTAYTRLVPGYRPKFDFIESRDFYQKEEDKPPTYEESSNKPMDDAVFYNVLVNYLGTGKGKPRVDDEDLLVGLLSVEFKNFRELDSRRKLAIKNQNGEGDFDKRERKPANKPAMGCDVEFHQKVSQAYDRLPEDLRTAWDEAGEKKSFVMALVAEDISRQNSRTMAGESISFLRYFPHVEDDNGAYLGESCIASFSSTSKYCSIKGGDHTNNHVYFVADFKRMVYYQRCWNAECIAKTSSRSRFPMRVTEGPDKKKKETEKMEKMVEEMFYDSLSKTSSNSCRGEDVQLSQSIWADVSDFLEIRRKFRKEFSVFLGETLPDANLQTKEVFVYPSGSKKENAEIEDVIMGDLIDLVVREESKTEEELKRKKRKVKKKRPKVVDSDEELLNSLF
jgi:hypothetical protein